MQIIKVSPDLKMKCIEQHLFKITRRTLNLAVNKANMVLLFTKKQKALTNEIVQRSSFSFPYRIISKKILDCIVSEIGVILNMS